MISAQASRKLHRFCCGSLFLLLVSVCPLSVSADIFSFSLAAMAGSAKYQQKNSPQNFSVDIETLGLRGSFNFLDLVHIDAEYATSLDKQDFSVRGQEGRLRIRSNAQFDNLSLWLRVGIPLPLPFLDPYVMVGFSNLDPKYSNSAVTEPSLDQGQQYGLGIDLGLPALPLELILEYVIRPAQNYDEGTPRKGRAKYSSLNLGVRWDF